jgi:pantoate--beta-alanine ligase
VTRVFDDLEGWREQRRALARSGLTVGFVPTMGALHEGHLSLVRRSLSENDRTLVSIFVNPTQFDDHADLARYPRDVDADLAALRSVPTDYVLLPRAEDLYRDGFRYRITERDVSATLEGAHRPGHFDGVLTVVMKLLQIAQPDRAYFGEKDWQQLSLVRGMAGAFFLPVTIVACPTVRDADGLALSSRNGTLSPADRQRAPRFHQVLSSALTPHEAARELRAAGFVVDYVEEHDGRRLGAVRIGGVRLIDNIPVASPRRVRLQADLTAR